MKNIFKKPFRWAIFYSLVMAAAVTFVLMDTFVIEQTGTPMVTASLSAREVKTDSESQSTSGAVTNEQSTINQAASTPDNAVITENSYKDDNIQITIDTVRKYDTTLYVADIQVSSAQYLKTAFAKGTYGRNIKQTTSDMAESNNAIFAINGDYYGFRDYGFVIRNGVLYRNTPNPSGTGEAMMIDKDGNLSIVNEQQSDAQALVDSGAWQVLSFGPALVNNGKITVDENTEVGKAMASNPRTAIGQISPLHYIVIVSDGRTSESAGLSLLQLAQEFSERGCTVAYNLDGGGSSTMWFNGKVVNVPANGRSSSQRSVSDIVYLGY
ncbi:phosphodiester glycosidase family protein [Acetanaerobacterium elongatum]|uniref:Exopolysaccharide biosynthesis protein n=1 Tax=Acetanaerobacterium elongatum TaxID=258515 RepID=A0A1H0DZD6_9FIRM|nr:phosphodiester glycosidase family protein [Acetanaerobacterium elongatum]SDN75617.1 Exopolysaccharide biosynthesis protein [Acetanaerobacterium elongatum]